MFSDMDVEPDESENKASQFESRVSFRNLLKANKERKTLLYMNDDPDVSCSQIPSKYKRVDDVISSIVTTVRAIQNADKMYNVAHQKFSEFKNLNLLPVSMVDSDDAIARTNLNKFETQCVSDTQLIDIVEGAEVLDQMRLHKGITQEFNISFHNKHLGNDDLIKKNIEKDNAEDILYNKVEIVRKGNITKKNLEDNIELPEETYTSKPLHEDNMDVDFLDPKNPLLYEISNQSITKKHNNAYSLETFEKFEQLATLIVYNQDECSTEKLKTLINSQIIGKELFLPSKIPLENFQPFLFGSDKNPSTNKNSLVDDEILFSSDEDIDYQSKDFRDMPMTLSMNRSGSIESEILDNTMFVGFTTASNKSIQVLSESFVKAKEVLDITNDIDKNLTVTALLETSKYAAENPDVGLNENNKVFDKSTPSMIDENHAHDKSQDKISFLGFKTASDKIVNVSNDVLNEASLNLRFTNTNMNKNINTSEKSVDKTKNICNINNFDIFGFKTASHKPIKLSANSLAKSKLLLQDFDNEASKAQFPKTATYGGFSTASNKKIKITDGGLAKTLSILHDIIDTDDFHLESNQENNTIIKKSNKITNLELCENSIDFQNFACNYDTLDKNRNVPLQCNEDKRNEPQFIGFSTASNKKIEISEKTLENSKKLLEIIDDAKPVFGFKTASNKDIHISAQSLAKSKQLLEEVDMANSNNSNRPLQCIENKGNDVEPQFMGFSTASNKKINISKKALECSKRLLQQIDNYTELEPSFKTASNKNIKISAGSLAKIKQLLKEVDMASANDSKRTLQCIDDKGNDIESQISETALESSKRLLEQVDNTELELGFKTASNKNIKISAESLAKSKQLLEQVVMASNNNSKIPLQCIEDKENDAGLQAIGFSTASNKKIKISEKALESSKRLLEQADNTELELGFKTASNKNIEISAESLAKSKQLLEKVDMASKNSSKIPLQCIEDKENDVELQFIGFSTASNKKIKISEKALESSKRLLEQADNTELELGFKTASNKNIEISPESLAKRRQLLEEVDMASNNNSKIPLQCIEDKDNDVELQFIGFCTASNKKIKFSEKALESSKRLLEQADNTELELGFKTASNKNIEISAESLAKSKQLLEEVDMASNNNSKIPLQCIEDKDNDVELQFIGFSTASNKKIKISEKVLESSKILLEQADNTKLELGFKTASNKNIEISAESLAKSKQLLEEVDMSSNNNSKIQLQCIEDKDVELQFIGFSTASNKKIKISEKALESSKRLLEQADNTELELGFKTAGNKISAESLKKSKQLLEDERESSFARFNTANDKPITISSNDLIESKKILQCDKEEEHNVDDKLNTLILNDFENTLDTEDFCKERQSLKRSGSPIIVCPRAKKRKTFKVPYKDSISVNELNLKTDLKLLKPKHVFKFNENYKKNTNRVKLKSLIETENKIESNVDVDIFHFDDLLNFVFNGKRSLFKTDANIDDLKEIFLDSIDKKIVPAGWLDNHLRLILWKLISYEIKSKIMSCCCNMENVLEQLKYRYNRELNNVERPALRKILEKDEVSTRSIVLCVMKIYEEEHTVSSVTNLSSNIELQLTDGWYCVTAMLDKLLIKMVYDGIIKVGTKIITNGAEMVNNEQGVAPWEDTSNIRLKIFGNSTRRVRWDTKLGFYHKPYIPISLRTVKLDGSKISKLNVFVTRVYPMLYVEKFEDGSTVTRSERLEFLHQMKCESEYQAALEKIYEDVEKEYQEDSQDSDEISVSISQNIHKGVMETGSQIVKMMKRCQDLQEFKAKLSDTQNRELHEYTSKRQERIMQDIQSRVEEKIKKLCLSINRNVISLLKVRIVDVNSKNKEFVKGMLSIWKPSEHVIELIKEGVWINVMNVMPTALRCSELHISAGRQSIFSLGKNKSPQADITPLKRTCTPLKELVSNPNKTLNFNEVDTVGLIFQIEPSAADFEKRPVRNQNFQNVFLTDVSKNFICINFWGGLKKFGFDAILEIGSIVYCMNLQKRIGNTRKTIPQFRVTELTYFTKTPRNENAQLNLNECRLNFQNTNIKDFCQNCVNTKIKMIQNDNYSPYKFNTTEYNISKNKIFIDSPLIKPINVEELNLTGLDFESSFKQLDTQSPANLRKQKVNERIAKLKIYGDPPPLSSMQLLNKSIKAHNPYISPFAQNSIARETNVTDISTNTYNQSNSPVINLNKTYVKKPHVNPIKLNFNQTASDKSENDFSDEFDYSPPLSLE